jgi:outer membrane protein assembly factor BamB
MLFVQSTIPVSTPTGDASHRTRGGVAPRELHRFVLFAIDRKSGKILWQRTATEATPHEASHPDNGTWASSSAATDGQHVIAFFESFGLYAYDMKGTLVWQKDLGDKQMRNEFGEGSTPVLYDNHVVVVWDHQGSSFIAAFDKRSGKELWRVPRDEIDTWATPLVVEHNGKPQVIAPGMNKLRSYDLETGAIVWESPGVTMNPIPSPVAENGMVFVTSGFRGNNLKAIRLADARGDISKSGAIVWSLDRDTPYVPSPLLYNGVLYILKTNTAVLSAFDAATGKPHFALQRLDGLDEVFSSPVGAAGRVYITDRHGTTLVIKQGGTFEVLAKNVLEDGIDASPALVGNEIYMRGYKHLYAIAAP